MIDLVLNPNVLIWIAQILYTVCFVPQIIVNYQLKSGKGLNDSFLFAYLNTLLPLLFYAFCVGLPPAYKVFYPIQTLALFIVILQRLWYDRMPNAKIYWLLYMINLAVPLTLIPYSIGHCPVVGPLAGWIFFLISFINQVPLVIKIARTESVHGISFTFISIVGIAGIIESYVALVLGLPIQTILGALRVVLFYIIFCILFLIYKNKSNA